MSLMLSANTGSNGERRFRAVFKGQPVCADKPTLREAWEAARHFFPEAEPGTVKLWDGDLGRYTEWRVE